MPAPVGGIWLVEPLGASPQFTGADFTEDDLLYAKTAEDFVRNEVLTRLDDLENKVEGLMPTLLRRAGELGLLMIDVPQRYGGLGLRKTTSMLVSERGALCASFSVSWGAHTGIGTLPIVYYGTEAQKQTYLPRLATGEWLAAYALTEPGSGSDALAAHTTATREGDSWRLSGVKQFITNAGFADLFTVFAKVDGEHFTAFLVERTMPGVSTGDRKSTRLNSSHPSSSYAVFCLQKKILTHVLEREPHRRASAEHPAGVAVWPDVDPRVRARQPHAGRARVSKADLGALARFR